MGQEQITSTAKGYRSTLLRPALGSGFKSARDFPRPPPRLMLYNVVFSSFANSISSLQLDESNLAMMILKGCTEERDRDGRRGITASFAQHN